jgi:hypothetical protein
MYVIHEQLFMLVEDSALSIKYWIVKKKHKHATLTGIHEYPIHMKNSILKRNIADLPSKLL